MTIQEIYSNSFIFLLFRITPSMRYIYLDIENDKNKRISLIAYFENEASEIEREMIEDIGMNIISTLDELYLFKSTIIVTSASFNNLSKTPYLIYGRYEPGVAY